MTPQDSPRQEIWLPSQFKTTRRDGEVRVTGRDFPRPPEASPPASVPVQKVSRDSHKKGARSSALEFLKRDNAIAAEFLGAIHGTVGAPEDFVGEVAGPPSRNTDADGDEYLGLFTLRFYGPA